MCADESLFEVFDEASDDAYAEPDPGIDSLDGEIPRFVAEGRDLQLVRRRVGNAPVVVPPIPQEVVSRRLGSQRVKEFDNIASLVVGAPRGGCLVLSDR